MKSKTTQQQRAVLGGLILRPSLYVDVCDFLHPVMFDGKLREVADWIWEKQGQMGGKMGIAYDKAMAVDALGPIANELISEAPLPGMMETQSIEIKRDYDNRTTVQIIGEAESKILKGEDSSEVIPKMNADLEILATFTPHKDRKPESVLRVKERISMAMKSEGGLSGITTGFKTMNEFMSGWQPGRLYYIPARPKMGKTTLMVSFAISAVNAGHPVAFISYEMPMDDIMTVFCSLMSGIDIDRIQNGSLSDADEDAIDRSLSEIMSLPIYILDRNEVGSSIEALTDKARQLKEINEIKIMFVDYIQLMQGQGDNRNYEVESVSRGLKGIALKNQISVVAGCQLNRSVENRGGSKEPQPSDTRDSGSIEQDCDAMYFPYRPAYYKILEDEEGNSTKGVMYLLMQLDRFNQRKCPERIKILFRDGRLQDAKEIDYEEEMSFPTAEDDPIIRRPVQVNGDPGDDLPF